MEKKKAILSDDFIVPPYSVFDARMGYWKERKRVWKDWLGVTNETREDTLYDNLEMKLPGLYISSKEDRKRLAISFSDYVSNMTDEKLQKWENVDAMNGASSFDPVLAEIACRWFTPDLHSTVFDCCAGGVTKGAVACRCGYSFFGTELREEQVATNNAQALSLGVSPTYVCDDGVNISKHLGVATQDLLLSCPPYFDLEKYSTNPNDLSNQIDYGSFIEKIGEMYGNAISCLKWNRFAVIVVGDIRDKVGGCYNFPGDLIKIFQSKGCVLWNDIVIVGNDAHAKIRARQYMNNRKIVRMHQRMLVFYKGRTTAIQKNFPKLTNLTSNNDI